MKKSDHEAIAAILAACSSAGETAEEIRKEVKIGNARLNPLLDLLIERGHIEIRKEGPAIVHATTEKGKDLAVLLERVNKILHS